MNKKGVFLATASIALLITPLIILLIIFGTGVLPILWSIAWNIKLILVVVGLILGLFLIKKFIGK